MKAEKIIVRREPKRNGGGIILFFPESYTKDNRYQLQYWTPKDGHGYSLDKEYYNVCTPVFTDYDEGDDIKQILSNYVRYVRTLPDMENYSYKRAYRISRK